MELPDQSAKQTSDQSATQATQACIQCSRLKRKCQRELPACSLCVRLGKSCGYPTGRRPYGSGRTSDAGPSSAAESTVSGSANVATASFPHTFFLDRELFSPVPHFSLGGSVSTPTQVSLTLGADSSLLRDTYFGSIDTWFPFVAKKRLADNIHAAPQNEASSVALLLLCMQLVVYVPHPGSSAASASKLYREAKAYLNNVEQELPTSLHVMQSLVLIALYEIGHGIFPAAYLTIGRAARLGILRGIHDRKNGTQLFRTPPTWTYWEEERRTWWATLILERYINIGPRGLPLATPEPLHGELLPTSDKEWLRGGIGTNPALFVGSFPSDSNIGPFARACQASHMLGRLLHHRNGRRDGPHREFRLTEALQLNTTLMALDNHLCQPIDDAQEASASSMLDIALCASARCVLYHMYACNEPDVLDERRNEESVLQAICIEGLKQLITIRLPPLARHVIHQGAEHPERCNPLIAQCLYDAASECQWLLREGDMAIAGTDAALDLLMEALGVLAKRWGVAG